MTTAAEGRRHFSPQLNKWVGCDAQFKRCQYEHITESEYVALASVQSQEDTLLNSSLGQAETSYIGAKTSMSAEEIQQMLRELRREGSVMPQPTQDELRDFIEKERFKVQHDDTLTSKEKREILKNLKQAEKDLDQHSVTGGVLHAWKNGISTAFQKIKKPVLAGALVGSLAFGLAACAPTGNTTPPDKEGTTTSETVEKQPAATEDCTDGTAVSGDIILGKKAKTIDGGEYCTVTINPEAVANDFNAVRIDPELYAAGYNPEMLEDAQKTAVKYYAENMVAGPATGQDDKKVMDWVSKQTNDLSPELLTGYASENSNSKLSAEGLSFSSNSIVPPLVEDGGALVTKSDITVASMTPARDGNGNAGTDLGVAVNMTSNTTYRVDPSKYVQWRKGFLESMEQDSSGVEAEGQDMTKPLFFTVERQQVLSFSRESLFKNSKDLKVRYTAMNIKDAVSNKAHN